MGGLGQGHPTRSWLPVSVSGLWTQSLGSFYNSCVCIPGKKQGRLKQSPTLSQGPHGLFIYYLSSLYKSPDRKSKQVPVSDIYFSASLKKYLIWVSVPQDLIRWTLAHLVHDTTHVSVGADDNRPYLLISVKFQQNPYRDYALISEVNINVGTLIC